MKTNFIFCCLAFVSVLFSCNKDAPVDNVNTASIEFTLNEKNYKWSFQPDRASLQQGATLQRKTNQNTNQRVYVLDAWSSPDGISVLCFLNTSVLGLGTFNITTAVSDLYVNSICQVNGIKYVSYAGDGTSVTITKISGNYVSGYFSAVMHDMISSTSEIKIYKGYFSNILIEER